MQLTSAELYVLTSKRNNYHLHFNFFAAFCTHKKLFDVKGDLSREPDAQEKPSMAAYRKQSRNLDLV